MRRREFLGLVGGVTAWPLATRAQQPAVPVIGFLHTGELDLNAGGERAFREGLSAASSRAATCRSNIASQRIR
jgi:hypothetical protein